MARRRGAVGTPDSTACARARPPRARKRRRGRGRRASAPALPAVRRAHVGLQLDRPPGLQRFAQRMADPRRLERVRERRAAGGALAAHRRDERLRLDQERILEAVEERRRAGVADARRIIDLDAVRARVAADRERARRADHFGVRVVAVRHRARRIEHREPAAFELADRDAVVDVAARAQPLVQRDRARRVHARRARRAEQPSCDVDVVHGAIEEDAARARREAHEKALGIVPVAGLRAHEERPADLARRDARVRVAIARIEAAHETDRRDEMRPRARLGEHPLAFAEIERQRFLAEHVLARAQRGDDLVRVQRRRRDEPERVELGIGRERVEILVDARHGERLARPRALVGKRAARGREPRARDAPREVLRVAPAEPAEPRDADAHRSGAVTDYHRIAPSGRPLAECHRAGLAPRQRRRLGELERLHAVGDRRAHRLAARHRREEMRDLARVRGAIALEEERLGQIRRHRARRVARHLGRPHVARLQHAGAAEHFEALIVAVCGAARRVDLAEPAALRADRDRGRIDVARAGDRRVGQATARRVQRVGIVVEDPAEDVEIVDQHVLEDAARVLDVVDGRRARIAARHDEHLRRADLARVDAALERLESRIEAALKADHADDARPRDGRLARAGALERQIDGLLAEHVLARARGADDQLGVRIGARADHRCADRRVAERAVDVGRLRAVLRGERGRRVAVHVDHVLQAHAGPAREIARMNAADAPGAEHGDVDRRCCVSHRILQCP
ncbi:hypothetical protein BURPS1710b_1837 [Burkholderia pseudomallei 1710b]|uniref:Uncharacterized protein n=1 Tax=Burkholderia pseudomallei (strain 1710b) TaxID=320372 RepID=Q3JT66_BURP1|nr:hypothetical protein BURPS1710b_1837 [Burkholderia pseudomallei 1710b]